MTSICLCLPRTPELFHRAAYADDHVAPPRRWGGLGFDLSTRQSSRCPDIAVVHRGVDRRHAPRGRDTKIVAVDGVNSKLI